MEEVAHLMHVLENAGKHGLKNIAREARERLAEIEASLSHGVPLQPVAVNQPKEASIAVEEPAEGTEDDEDTGNDAPVRRAV